MPEKAWDSVFDIYVKKLISPDGRDTFESTDGLINIIMEFAELTESDTVIDIGSGWGNVTIPVSQKVKKVISIELDKKI